METYGTIDDQVPQLVRTQTSTTSASSERERSETPDQSKQQPPGLSVPVFSPAREENEACLSASLLMLRAAMDSNSKAYEYLLQSPSTIPCATNGMDCTNPEESKRWLSMMEDIEHRREQETSQLKRDLQKAKAKSQHYKAELRENLSERLQLLEQRASVEQRHSHSQNQRDSYNNMIGGGGTTTGGESITVTTHASTDNGSSSSAYAESTNEVNQPNPIQPSILQQRLEQTQYEFSQEKREWLRRLDVIESRYSADLQSWQRQLAALKDDSRRLTEERDQLLMEKDNQDGGHDGSNKLKGRLDQTRKERDEALALLNELQGEYSHLQRELESSRAKVKEAKRKGAKEMRKMYQEELRALDEPIADVEVVYRETLEQRKELQARLRHAELQHANDKATWKLQLECALASARNVAAEHEQIQKQLDQTLEMHAKEKKEWQHQWSTELSKLAEEHMSQQEEWAQNATQEQEQQHKTQLNQLRAQVRQVQEQLAQTQIQLKESKEQDRESRKRISELELEHEAALANSSRLSEILAEAREQHSQKEEEMAKQFVEAQSQVLQLSAIADQVPQLKKDAEEAQADAVRMSDKLVETQKKHSKEVAVLKEKHSKLLEDHTSQISKGVIDSLRDKIQHLEAALEASELAKTTAGSEIESQQLKNKLKEFENELETLKARNISKSTNEYEEQISRLQSTHKSDMENAKHKLAESERLWEQKEQDLIDKLESSDAKVGELEIRYGKASRLTERIESDKNAELKSRIRELEIERAQLVLGLQRCEEDWNNKFESLEEQINNLRQKETEAEARARIAAQELTEARKTHSQKVTELLRRLSDSEKECQDVEHEHAKTILDLETKHTHEVGEMTEKHNKDLAVLVKSLEDAQTESIALSDKSNMLASSLEQVNSLHENKTCHWETEIGRLEQENAELHEMLAADRQGALVAQERIASGLEKHQKEISCAVLELRNDLAVVREATGKGGSTLNESNVQGLVESVDKIHANIHDTLAEITLETENLIECRSGILSLVERTNMLLGPDDSLRNHMRSLEEMLAKVLDRGLAGDSNEPLPALATCMAELLTVKDLLARERTLKEDAEKMLVLKTEQLDVEKEERRKAEQIVLSLEDHAEQLAFERKMREKAEQEIVTLNDQADSYGEELMRLQAEKTGLEDTLREAEERMEAALETNGTAKVFDFGNHHSVAPVDAAGSSPMLDEALALAQNLTALIQDQNDTERETSVMEMLETISEMIDNSETPVASQPPCHIDVPVRLELTSPARCDEDDDLDENPPLPITSPPLSVKNPSTGDLTMVVDQLYSRCQMLERERTEIMEVTLDILQSAREASSAELEAALATARRKSAEEIMKVRQENQKTVWRMYHKLTGYPEANISGTRQSGIIYHK